MFVDMIKVEPETLPSILMYTVLTEFIFLYLEFASFSSNGKKYFPLHLQAMPSGSKS